MRRPSRAAQIRVEALEGRALPSTGAAITPSVTPPDGWVVYQQLTEPDGTVIIVGSAADAAKNVSDPATTDFAVARYTPDGNLDPTFGNGGTVLTAVNSGYDMAYDVALQPDGKLVVVGEADANAIYDNSGNATVDPGGFALVRYNSDGSLDTAFGTGGEVVTPFPLASDWGAGQAFAVALQPDGSIVVGGTADGDVSSEFTVARYTAAGTLDDGFGSGGVVQLSFGGYDSVSSLSVQADGTILAEGTSDHIFVTPDFVVLGPDGPIYPTPTPSYTLTVSVQLNPDGSLDAGYGNGGEVVSGGPQNPPGTGDGGGGVVPLVLLPTPFAVGFSKPGLPETPSAAGPSPTAVSNAADAPTSVVTTPAAPVSHPTTVTSLPFVPAPAFPTFDSPQSPISAVVPVAIATPTGTAAEAAANASTPAPLGISHTKTGDAPPADGGTDGDKAAPPEPIVDPGDGVAALRDDYFSQTSPALSGAAAVDGAVASQPFFPAAAIAVGWAGLPMHEGRGRRRRFVRTTGGS